MSDLLLTVVAFAVALGILIAVHEFGHYWVARRLGVKVLRFSIGFGKPLWTRRGAGADRTEYSISAIPIGGYVKMLDEREGEVSPDEVHRAFNRQSVAKRFAIVSAGPLFNFLFAIVAYWMMMIYGVPGLQPVIGEIEPGSVAAETGLRTGQTVISVDGEETPTWGAVFDELIPAALRGKAVELTVQNPGDGTEVHRLPLEGVGPDIDPQTLPQRIGLRPFQPPIEPVVGRIEPNTPAAEAGIRAGDRIVQVAGTAIEDWEQLVDIVSARAGEPTQLLLLRDGRRIEVTVTPEPVETEQGKVGRIGAAVEVDPSVFEQYQAEQQYGPLEAVIKAPAKTWEMATLTVEMLWEMLVGRAPVESISGPITIAVYAKASAVAGVAQFLSFLAIVSISLGVLNLLPIPVLDGGHLMFYVVEAIKGSPVSEATEAVAQRVGIALILMLMMLAFYNDITRLAG